jgi:hypothetical protein
MEQCLLRDDIKPILRGSAPQLNIQQSSSNSNSKFPIKIASVVLDGLEMKLASNSSGFGSNKYG